MPIKHAAQKYLRKSRKRQQRNEKVRNTIDRLTKLSRQAIQASDAQKAKEAFQKLTKALDKAVKSKVIKKNTAARKKSRISKMINKINKK